MTTDRTPTTAAGRRLLSWYRSAYLEPTHDAFADAILAIEAEARAEPRAEGLRDALDLLDIIDGIVDDTHPEGDGCPLCSALDALRAALAPEPEPGR